MRKGVLLWEKAINGQDAGKFFGGLLVNSAPKKSNRKEANQSPVQETPEPEPTEASE
jgi:hypothetical protein